jgi:hypothetical protein
LTKTINFQRNLLKSIYGDLKETSDRPASSARTPPISAKFSRTSSLKEPSKTAGTATEPDQFAVHFNKTGLD